MTVNENEQVVLQGYQFFNDRIVDSAQWRPLFTDDPVWRTPGGPFEPQYKGLDAILGYYARLGQLSGGTIKVQPEVVVSDEDHVIVQDRMTASREGKALDMQTVIVFEMTHHRAATVTEYVPEPAKWEAFWA